jgi:hypothetical protein
MNTIYAANLAPRTLSMRGDTAGRLVTASGNESAKIAPPPYSATIKNSWRNLAADILNRALRDARSGDLETADSARDWLMTSAWCVTLLDLLNLDPDVVRGRWAKGGRAEI